MNSSVTFEGRVLITGGTGFVGGNLVRRLTESGIRLRLLVRHPERAEQKGKSLELVKGDIADPVSVLRAAEGCQAAIHLVGIIAEGWGRSYKRIHVEGTRNVVSACQQAGVAHYLHMSALGVRPGARRRYHQTKWESEEIVRSSGLAYTIFRPSVIFGEGDAFVNRFVGIARKAPLIPVLGNGLGLLQPIWVEDVISCFSQSLTNPETVGQTYELGGPEALGLEEIVDMIRQRVAPSKPLVHLPLWLLRPAAWLFRILPNPPLTNEQLDMLKEDNVCEVEPARSLFRLSGKRLGDYLNELVADGDLPASVRRIQ